MTRGRRPEWNQAVEALQGSDLAKDRLRVILKTLTGQQTVAQAAVQLRLSERRLHGLRGRMLQAAVAALEPRPAGRPTRPAGGPDERVKDLEANLRELQLDLKAAQVREEIALVMPRLLTGGGKAGGRRKGHCRRPGKSGGPAGCAASVILPGQRATGAAACPGRRPPACASARFGPGR